MLPFSWAMRLVDGGSLPDIREVETMNFVAQITVNICICLPCAMTRMRKGFTTFRSLSATDESARLLALYSFGKIMGAREGIPAVWPPLYILLLVATLSHSSSKVTLVAAVACLFRDVVRRCHTCPPMINIEQLCYCSFRS